MKISLVLFIFQLGMICSAWSAVSGKKPGQRRSNQLNIIKCCGGDSCVPRDSTGPFSNSSITRRQTASTMSLQKTENLLSTTSSTEYATEIDPGGLASTENVLPLGDLDTTIGVESSPSVMELSSSVSSIISEIKKTSEITSSTESTTFNQIESSTFKPTETNYVQPTETSTSVNPTQTSVLITTKRSATTATPTQKKTVIKEKCETSVKNASLFKSDGSLKEPDRYGYWEISCNLQYLFGKSLVSWSENSIKCQAIGMNPITLESSEKAQCFRNIASNWKYGSNYWTAGLRATTSDFSWCSASGSIALDKSKVSWAVGQPNNANGSENCLRINVTNASFQISDQVCTEEFLFACQGRPTPAPPCSSPACPNVTCAKNNNFYKNSSSGVYLADMTKHGYWSNYRGRTFLFSYPNDTQTFLGAHSACCQVDMFLVSLEYDYKFNSIREAAKGNLQTQDYFWTSGSDRGCEGNYGYCTAKRLLRKEAIWGPRQPDNAGGKENAIAVFINATRNQTQLFDFDEMKKFRYICEARDTANAQSGGSAVRDECAQIYNVSQKEIDNLLNNTSKLDLRLKCFIRCIGDNSGLMVDGKFLDNKVLAILETMSNGSIDELKKGMSVMGDCENSASGMDECDKAAQVIKCSKEKAPEMLSNVILAMDKSMPVGKSSPKAFCYNPDNCTIDPVQKKLYDSALVESTLSNNAMVVFACGKKWLVHRRTIVGHTLQEGFKVCCEYGLKIASIETLDMLNCLTATTFKTLVRWNWFGVSLTNSPSKPRWCTSEAPFLIENWVGAKNLTKDPQFDALKFHLSNKTVVMANQKETLNILCSPL
ncbi:uncharacterized protein LOC132204590 [Neocloeon triangulifer]|uniref:uncharacterized protein LOC132204590 n=1 Tax=Neocloeon triangulifer TaxID=2078957 RepID=UPI00286F6FC1|nr:uncharacterized protein LOC132204590 [Neocloeon triangulifer]